MKSPFADCEAVLEYFNRETKYRGETYEYTHFRYTCPITGRGFTTNELDGVNTEQVYKQFRERHNIPTVTEHLHFRLEHGLSMAEMAERVGVTEQQYKWFEEQFKIPTVEEGAMLRAAITE